MSEPRLKETERVQAGPGGPGRGPFGGGMVGQKANTFGPSARRLIARMRPERTKVFVVLVLTTGAVFVVLVAVMFVVAIWPVFVL